MSTNANNQLVLYITPNASIQDKNSNAPPVTSNIIVTNNTTKFLLGVTNRTVARRLLVDPSRTKWFRYYTNIV